MTVGIIGLGLIGGSMARAYKAAGHTVFGFDINSASLGYAVLSDIIDNELTDDKINECELIFIALYPEAAEKYLEEKAKLIPQGCMVIDLCGTKRRICEKGFRLARENGFTFTGGHPMADFRQAPTRV